MGKVKFLRSDLCFLSCSMFKNSYNHVMEILGNKLPSSETVARVLANFVRPEKEKRPLVVAFYVTFACNANCGFCSQGEFVHGPEKKRYNGAVKTEDQIQVLRAIRRDVPNIYFEGGEPTVHRDFGRILDESVALGFDSIGVNTNGLLYCPEILEKANLLVVSLHSMDPAKIACIYGVEQRRGAQVLDNIKRYSNEYDPGKLQMVLNCVVKSDNIEDVYEVAEFCRELGVYLNVAPAILPNGRPDAGLVQNHDYQALIDWLCQQKGLMASSPAYLEMIRNFEPFVCTPNVIPGVYPSGDMIVPCQYLSEGREIMNVIEAGGVNKALEIGRARFEERNGVLDTKKRCAPLCHKTCYVEGSTLSTVGGLVRLVRGAIFSF
jgi:MoaA/NifB/PqqE/SkfB family radical SAM enzyme